MLSPLIPLLNLNCLKISRGFELLGLVPKEFHQYAHVINDVD